MPPSCAERGLMSTLRSASPPLSNPSPTGSATPVVLLEMSPGTKCFALCGLTPILNQVVWKPLRSWHASSLSPQSPTAARGPVKVEVDSFTPCRCPWHSWLSPQFPPQTPESPVYFPSLCLSLFLFHSSCLASCCPQYFSFCLFPADCSSSSF